MKGKDIHQPAARRGRIADVTKTSCEPPRNDTGTFMVEHGENLAQLDGDEDFVPATIEWDETPQQEFDSPDSRVRLGLDEY